MLLDCLAKVGKALASHDREELENAYQDHLDKGLSEREASLNALVHYHKGVFDEVNELREKAGVPVAEYVHPAEKGKVEVPASVEPTAAPKFKRPTPKERYEADRQELVGGFKGGYSSAQLRGSNGTSHNADSIAKAAGFEGVPGKLNYYQKAETHDEANILRATKQLPPTIKRDGKIFEARPALIEEIIKRDPDLQEYIAKNNPPAGRKVSEPVVIGIKSRGIIIDGYNRIAQAISNGQRLIPAYIEAGQPSLRSTIAEAGKAESLATVNDFSEIVPKVETSVDGNTLKLDTPEAVETARTLLSFVNGRDRADEPVIDGLFLDPKNVAKLKAAAEGFVSAAPDHIDTQPIRALIDNLDAAAKKNGTVKLMGDDSAVDHEAIHESSYLGSNGKALEKRYDGAADVLKSDPVFQDFHQKLNDLQGKSPHGVAMEEALAYLGSGAHERFGLDKDQSTEILAKLIEGYAKENGVESLRHFEPNTDLYETVQRTIDGRGEGGRSGIGDESSVGVDSERETGSETAQGEPAEDAGGEGAKEQAKPDTRGLTQSELASAFNRFSKSGDLSRYGRKFRTLSTDEKIRVAENLRAGDDPETAIKDAKEFIAPFGPGTANVGDVPNASAMKQLGAAIEHINKEQGFFGRAAEKAGRVFERKGLNTALEEADKQGRGWLNTAMLRGHAVWDWYSKRPEYTDYKRTLGDFLWADQKSAAETSKFVDSINKAAPDRITQEALTNWIQADGATAKLREWADASTGRTKQGYEKALALTPEQQTIATNIQAFYEAKLAEGQELGLIHDAVENYVNQVWKRNDPITQKLVVDWQQGLLNPNFKFSKKRTFQNFFEGEQAGYRPVTKKVGDLVGLYNESFEKAKISRQFIKELQGVTATDGRPAVAITGMGSEIPKGETVPDAVLVNPKAKGKETGDYAVINHPSLRNWKWVASIGEDKTPIMVQGDLAVHPEIYPHLKNVLGKSAFNNYAIARGVKMVNSTIKQTMLSLSAFHQVQEGVHAMGHKVSPWRAGGKDFEIDFDDPTQKKLISHGLQVASHDALGKFSEGVSGGNLVNKLPVVGKYFQQYQDWLFKQYIPRLKMVMALHAYERNTTRYKNKLTDDQIAAMTAEQGNAAFGELNYRMMGRNPTLQDAMRTFLLAPDFLEARGRFVGQALKPYGKEQMAALALLAATQYVTARIANKLLDDDYHWGADDAFKVYYAGHWYGLRTVPGDIIHLVSDPRSFSYHRLSPLMRGGIEALLGRDDRGNKVNLVDQAKDMAPIPLMLRKKTGDEWWEPFMNSVGVQEGKEHTAADKVINQYYQEKYPNGFPKPDDPKKAELRKKLLEQLRSGKDTDETELQMQRLRDSGDLTERDFKTLETKSKLTPFQARIKVLPVKVAIDVWNVATDQEKDGIRDMLKVKIRNGLAKKTLTKDDVPRGIQ